MALLIEPPYRPMKALSVAPQRTFGSLLLGLYDDQGLLHHVGFTSGFRRDERKALLNGPTQIHGQRFRAANFDGGYDT